MVALEIWVDIKGHEGYQVSSYGRVRSKDRICYHVQYGQVVARKHKGRILSQNDNGHGYLTVQLGRGNRLYVHRLVAEHFIPNPNGYEEINHRNANKQDNRVDNLEWCDRRQNIDHSVKNGVTPRGSRVWASLLREDQVREIKELLLKGKITQSEIAEMFGVSQQCVSDIKLGRTWKHVS